MEQIKEDHDCIMDLDEFCATCIRRERQASRAMIMLLVGALGRNDKTKDLRGRAIALAHDLEESAY